MRRWTSSRRPSTPSSEPTASTTPDRQTLKAFEVLSGRRKDLEEVAKSSHARKPVDVGAIYRAPTTSSVAAASDSPCLDVTGESCLRNPLREICTVGSVREELSRWGHGGPKRARSWKRRIQPRKHLQPIGTPLLGETPVYNSNQLRVG